MTVLLITLATGLLLSFLLGDNTQAAITAKVKNHLPLLTETAERITADKSAVGYTFKGAKEIRYREQNKMIEFTCKSAGFVAGSSYYGFYFSPKDVPLGFEGTQMAFVEDGLGWKFEEADGDNWDYTEKIVDHWYYFEMHF